MSQPAPTITLDPAVEVLSVVMQFLAEAYAADSTFPPEEPVATVHLVAGEGPAIAQIDPQCESPFLWTRLMRRFRSASFPDAAVAPTPCRLPRAVAVEIGVGRCAVLEREPSFDDFENEAVISLEDGWRVECVLSSAARQLGEDYAVAVDAVEPFGPEGGVIGWTAVIYVQF